jgi:hypothetical protein
MGIEASQARPEGFILGPDHLDLVAKCVDLGREGPGAGAAAHQRSWDRPIHFAIWRSARIMIAKLYPTGRGGCWGRRCPVGVPPRAGQGRPVGLGDAPIGVERDPCRHPNAAPKGRPRPRDAGRHCADFHRRTPPSTSGLRPRRGSPSKPGVLAQEEPTVPTKEVGQGFGCPTAAARVHRARSSRPQVLQGKGISASRLRRPCGVRQVKTLGPRPDLRYTGSPERAVRPTLLTFDLVGLVAGP